MKKCQIKYFAINAGYSRKLHEDKNWYYAKGIKISEVKKHFKETFSWLDVYKVKEITYEQFFEKQKY
jgi:hypothetical protein